MQPSKKSGRYAHKNVQKWVQNMRWRWVAHNESIFNWKKVNYQKFHHFFSDDESKNLTKKIVKKSALIEG